MIAAAAGPINRAFGPASRKIDAALPGWVERSIQERYVGWAGRSTRELTEAAVEAGVRAGAEVGPAVRALLASDVDDQRTTPLTLLRGAVRYPTEVLRRFGVPPVARDRFAVERFPDDLRPWPHGKRATGRAVERLLAEGRLEGLLDADGRIRPAAHELLDEFLTQNSP